MPRTPKPAHCPSQVTAHCDMVQVQAATRGRRMMLREWKIRYVDIKSRQGGTQSGRRIGVVDFVASCLYKCVVFLLLSKMYSTMEHICYWTGGRERGGGGLEQKCRYPPTHCGGETGGGSSHVRHGTVGYGVTAGLPKVNAFLSVFVSSSSTLPTTLSFSLLEYGGYSRMGQREQQSIPMYVRTYRPTNLPYLALPYYAYHVIPTMSRPHVLVLPISSAYECVCACCFIIAFQNSPSPSPSLPPPPPCSHTYKYIRIQLYLTLVTYGSEYTLTTCWPQHGHARMTNCTCNDKVL